MDLKSISEADAAERQNNYTGLLGFHVNSEIDKHSNPTQSKFAVKRMRKVCSAKTNAYCFGYKVSLCEKGAL